MARSSSRSSSRAPAPAARSAPPPAVRAPPPPAPAPHAPAPVPAPSSGGGGMLAGLGSTMAQGFAFGTGSALAREAVGSIFGGSSSTPAPQQAAPAPVAAPAAPTACEYDQKAFQSCLRENPNSASNCDHYFTALQACQSRQ